MAAPRNGIPTITLASVAVFVSVASGIYGFINPHGDIESVKQSVSDLRKDVDWRYVQKELANKVEGYLKEQIAALQARVAELEHSQRAPAVQINPQINPKSP